MLQHITSMRVNGTGGRHCTWAIIQGIRRMFQMKITLPRVYCRAIFTTLKSGIAGHNYIPQ